jgi:hypothetical protein
MRGWVNATNQRTQGTDEDSGRRTTMLRKLVLAFAITLLPLSVQAAQQVRYDLKLVL